MKIEFQDRIDDYLLDRMSDEERKSFESDAAADAELKEQLSFTETVQKATKSRNEKLAAMEAWKDDYVWKEEFRPSHQRLFYWFSGIAAVFIVGFFLFNKLYVMDGNPSFSVDRPTYRAGSDYADIELLLVQKKYKEALGVIKEKSLVIEADSLVIAQDSTMEEDQKIYNMQIVKDKQDDLKWLKVYAMLGLHRQADALKLLEELRRSDGYYQGTADSLYNQIKK